MSNECYGFQSDPSDITVRIGETKKIHRTSKPAVIIEDPNAGHNYALHPDSARHRADLVTNYSDSEKCHKLADKINRIADRVQTLHES